jgi:hypothetical protein
MIDVRIIDVLLYLFWCFLIVFVCDKRAEF